MAFIATGNRPSYVHLLTVNICSPGGRPAGLQVFRDRGLLAMRLSHEQNNDRTVLHLTHGQKRGVKADDDMSMKSILAGISSLIMLG